MLRRVAGGASCWWCVWHVLDDPPRLRLPAIEQRANHRVGEDDRFVSHHATPNILAQTTKPRAMATGSHAEGVVSVFRSFVVCPGLLSTWSDCVCSLILL